MDSFDNVAGQKSRGSNDEIDDPELEARLYGEIYYSNETWIRDVDQPEDKDSTGKEQNIEAVLSEETCGIDTDNVVSQVESQNKSLCKSPKNVLQNSSSAFRRELSSEFPRSCHRIDNRPSKQSRVPTRQRFQSRLANEKFVESLVEEVRSTTEIAECSSTSASVSNAKTDWEKQRRSIAIANDEVEKRRRVLEERGTNKKNRGKTKKKNINMKESNSAFVEIPSDSDDSILEVPVPPRAQPPLIQLVDSEDEYGERENKSLRSPMKKHKEAKQCEEPSGRNVPLNCSEMPARANPDRICNETILLNVENPTSGCTSLQQNSGRREEVEIIHAADMTVRVNSDDSVTESEATNWINIAAGQASSIGNGEIFSIEESLPADSSSFRDRSTFVSATEPRFEDNHIHPSDRVSLGGTNAALPNNANISIGKGGEKNNEASKRKRRKDVDLGSVEKSNMLQVPRKKNKKNSCRANVDESLTDYFFKQMSKKLQDFYNEPWGSENLDVQRIQSTMPRNPRYWTILDADLSPVSKRRGKTCSRCGTNAHRGRRCPGKPVEPKCCMCGATGHLQTRCPQRMCLTCGRKYMTFRPTCDYCSNLYCYTCTGTGHTREHCPDSWRKYHDTTSETLPGPRDPNNIMKARQDLSCCNCAKRGHDSTMCKQLRWSQHFPTPMFVTSYTEGPVYPPVYREPARDASFECVQIPDDNDAQPINEGLLIQPEKSISYNNVVFQCGNLNPSNAIDLQSVSKYLGKQDNVHTRGLLDGNLQPTFLNLWLENFVFSVRITSGHDRESIHLVIEANSKDVLCGLEKLLMQWLTRSDEEKPYLTYDVLPYEDIKHLSSELRRKVSQITINPVPEELLKKIIASEETLRRRCGMLPQLSNENGTSDRARRKYRAIRFKLRAVMSQRCQLVTSLYAGGWVPRSDVIIRSFRKLVDKLKCTKGHIRIDDYMEIVYLHNEIFTFHMSNGLAEALRRATRITESSKESLPLGEPLEKQFVAWIDLNAQDETIQGSKNSSGGNNKRLHRPGGQILPNVTMKNAPIAENLRFTKCNNAIPTSSRTPMVNEDYIRLEESVQPIDQRGSHRAQTLLINHCAKAKKKNTKKSAETLIKNMKKKRRKSCRHSANVAIRKADSSRLIHIKRMAMELKKKLLDNSASQKDVKLLRDALSVEKRKKRMVKYSNL